MNTIKVAGTIIQEPIYNNTTFGEKFYTSLISVERTSGTCDVLPITVSELLVNEIKKGEKVVLYGDIRTRNRYIDIKRRLAVQIFVQGTSEYEGYDTNVVAIDGFICKKPVYRITAKSKKEIADVMLASNRRYPWNPDYIPCICWGRNARRAENMEVGTEVNVTGRLQSREYVKVLEDGSKYYDTTYEVSLSKVIKVEKEAVENE